MSLIGHIRSIYKGKNLALKIVRIPGALNVVADSLSRDTPSKTEWELHPLDWEWISAWIGPLQVDLMATSVNARLETFVSPFPHPRAAAVDAYMIDWNRWQKAYIFPPHKMLPAIWPLIRMFRGQIILIARVPSTHYLFPSLQHLSRASRSLRHPPRQWVSGKWISDGFHNSLPWTAWLFSGESGERP
jgi:hypothetical protein